MSRQRLEPEELHARLIVAIGVILAIVFAGSVFSLLYAFLFITQPLGEQAPNDKAAIDLVSTLCVFLTGTLAGIVSANGLKSKKKEGDKRSHLQRELHLLLSLCFDKTQQSGLRELKHLMDYFHLQHTYIRILTRTITQDTQ